MDLQYILPTGGAMKTKLRVLFFLSAALLFVWIFQVPSSYSFPQRPDISSGDATANPPVIDGDPSEWQSQPVSITLNNPPYPIQTYVYFMNDHSYLYVLVDVVGDTTNGSGCDECLLEFNSFPTTDIEVGFKDGGITKLPNPFPVGGQVQISFRNSFNSATPHRIYELRIPLSYIGAGAGQIIDFSSPSVKGICPSGSIPYDGTNGTAFYDNIYPSWLNQSDINTYARLHLQGHGTTIPTMTEWGMIIFTLLAGVGAIYYLRRQKRAKS